MEKYAKYAENMQSRYRKTPVMRSDFNRFQITTKNTEVLPIFWSDKFP